MLPLTLVLGCATGGEEDDFGTFGSFQTTVAEDDDEAEEEDTGETAEGSMEGTTTGDGDTTTTTDEGDDTTTTTDEGDDTTTTTDEGDDTTTTTDDGGAMCGNGMVEPGETCDSGNFDGASCAVLGYDGGMLSCNNCMVSTSTCTNLPQPGLGQLYSTCLDETNCPNLDGCITVMMQDMQPYDGFCTNICSSDAECGSPAAIGGTAVPKCNNEPTRYCELDCSGGKTCPQGMECVSLVGNKFLCF